MHDHHWFEDLRYQFERRGLSLILRAQADREWVATAWHRLTQMHYGGDLPVARALGATPPEAALRLLMVLDDAEQPPG